MDTDLADYAIELARSLGCSYAEARLMKVESNGMMLKNGAPQISGFDSSTGIGIRYLYRGSLGFLSSNRLQKSHIKQALNTSLAKTKAGAEFSQKVSFAEEKSVKRSYAVKQKKPFSDVSTEDRLEGLKRIHSALDDSKATLQSTYFNLSDSVTSKYIVNTDGVKVISEIPRISCFYMMTLQEGKKSNQRYWEHANVGGFEHFERWRLAEKLTREVEALRMNMLKGKKMAPRKVDVVVGPEISGIMAHEACGHPMEADRILGREAAQAGESFITPAMLGTRIGSEAVSVIDDPVIDGSYGYFLYDDEGVKARKKFLYKDGLINEFLHNKETAAILGGKANGVSRASAYDREPLLRMSNTFIAPGNHAHDELFEGIKLGVYMKNFTEWNIDDRRYQQKYVGAECYLIKDGSLTDEPVYGPALEITTPQLYGSIEACGKDLEHHPGNCGKGEPMQGMPVTLGGPSVRIKGVRLN